MEKDLPEIDVIIKKEYGIEIKKIGFVNSLKSDDINPYYSTIYSHTNYFVLNQILANYWLKIPEKTKKEDVKLFNKDRVLIQLKQAETIDQLSHLIRVPPLLLP
ncbi:hypothetical protein [Elizabethkingia anophelis]|uniref:Uncharacterized protein n=1 Tax=Elizabethkingia anophelis TaxID=1117645 RepID=A0A7Z7M098_9FLAO|nr:hypothetical protein [Elizabethkingia anophelis]STF08839.1 Uncharacterised protein [Elizabethkingia anophelis]